MTEHILQVQDLTKTFADSRGLVDTVLRRPPATLVAVDGVTLDIESGGAFGIVGESGCGKTTLASCITGRYAPTSGSIRFQGRTLAGERSPGDRRLVQMVFQDPYSSLNPRARIGSMLKELLRFHHLVPAEDVQRRSEELMDLVGLQREALHAHPRQLSGGQRQRASIARALALQPAVLVADEPVSALDVSVSATILNLLADLREALGLTIVLISHDLNVVHQVCGRVAVMYLGRIVEQGDTRAVFSNPQHPYTQALLGAVPQLHSEVEDVDPLKGDPPSPYEIPTGCRFRTRCPVSRELCIELDPDMAEVGDGHFAACHFAGSAAASS